MIECNQNLNTLHGAPRRRLYMYALARTGYVSAITEIKPTRAAAAAAARLEVFARRHQPVPSSHRRPAQR